MYQQVYFIMYLMLQYNHDQWHLTKKAVSIKTDLYNPF